MKLYWSAYFLLLAISLGSFWMFYNTCLFTIVCPPNKFEPSFAVIIGGGFAAVAIMLMGLISCISLIYKKLKHQPISKSEAIFSIVTIITVPIIYFILTNFDSLFG
ncbi:MAG: hypothetical protein KBC33_03000 [Candidatus Pacebacteria bacterium]|nr:hypothetical protein [Candidatus Paceibacterota bacterium]